MLNATAYAIWTIHKIKTLKIKHFLAFKLLDWFIILINVKNPTNQWYFNIYEQDTLSHSVKLSMKKVGPYY